MLPLEIYTTVGTMTTKGANMAGGKAVNTRTCDNCNCNILEGYVWGDGEGYACSDKCLFIDGYTQAQYDADYKAGNIYYTAWEGD